MVDKNNINKITSELSKGTKMIAMVPDSSVMLGVGVTRLILNYAEEICFFWLENVLPPALC